MNEDTAFLTWSPAIGKDGHSQFDNDRNSGPSTHGKFFFDFLGQLNVYPHLTGSDLWDNISSYEHMKISGFQLDMNQQIRKTYECYYVLNAKWQVSRTNR